MAKTRYLCARNKTDMKHGFTTYSFSSRGLSSLLSAFLLSGCVPAQEQATVNGVELQHGDLLFCVESAGEGLADAISSVTTGAEGAKVVHVAIACQDGDAMKVLEATPAHGVWLTSLEAFLEGTEKDEQGQPKVLVGRLTDTLGIAASVAHAREFIGLSYDTLYMPDASQIYCSELVQLSYHRLDGSAVFGTIPMSFSDSSGQIAPYWQKLYDSRGLPVPEGLPGTNPGALSRDEAIMLIYK